MWTWKRLVSLAAGWHQDDHDYDDYYDDDHDYHDDHDNVSHENNFGGDLI